MLAEGQMPQPPLPIDDSATRMVHAIVAQAKIDSGNLALPPLRFDESAEPSFFDQLREMVARAADWLLSFFPRPGNGTVAGLNLLIEGLLIVGGAFLLACLGFWIYRFLSTREDQSAPLNPRGGKLQIGGAELDGELRLALSRGDLPKASRLRWRIFLQRTRGSSSLTPREFCARSVNQKQLETLAYDVMFRKDRDRTIPADYQSLDEALSHLEQSTLAT